VAEVPFSVTGDRQLQVASPQRQLSDELVEPTNWCLRPKGELAGGKLTARKQWDGRPHP
jgi:hypothetical protein